MKDSVPVKIKQSIEKPPYSLPFSATGILHGYAAGRSPTAAAGQPVYPFLTVNDRGQPPPSRQLSGRKAQKYEIKIVNSHDRDPRNRARYLPACGETALSAAEETKHRKTMKRLLTMALLAILAIPLHAQRLVIGERVPDLNITQWLNGAPVSDGKAVMVEFYHSSNPKGAERLAQLDELAKSYGDRLAVIVVTREKDDAVISSLLGGNPSYRVGYDGNGSVFSAFSARYVPYSVIYDKRGRILWVGNPSSLSAADVADIIH